MFTEDTTPRVYLCCATCYKENHLKHVKLVDASIADKITPEDLHDENDMLAHKELWGLPHDQIICVGSDNMPILEGDLTPELAVKWYEALKKLGKYNDLMPGAFIAWVEDRYDFTYESIKDPYLIATFESEYVGFYDTFEDFVEEVIKQAYTAVDDNETGGIFVFQNAPF